MPENTVYPLEVSINQNFVLTLKLHEPAYKDQYEKCLSASFLVHSPYTMPSVYDFDDFKQFNYGMTLDVEITPEITITDKSLMKLSPDERDCYFEDEKTLRLFNTYTLENCVDECFINLTYIECECMRYSELRGKEMKVCKVDSLSFRMCDQLYKDSLLYNSSFTARQNCSCLPMCNSIKYNIKYFPTYHNNDNETILNFRLNTDDLVVYKRYQQFTKYDVVSYIGGLLGLFAGISFLSIFEFFYFVTLRLITNVWRFMK
jgi:acid-sensing ion channel, other